MHKQKIPYSRFHRVADLEVDLYELKCTADIVDIIAKSRILDTLGSDDRKALSHAISMIQFVGERAIEHFADLCDHIGCGSEFRNNSRPLTLD